MHAEHNRQKFILSSQTYRRDDAFPTEPCCFTVVRPTCMCTHRGGVLTKDFKMINSRCLAGAVPTTDGARTFQVNTQRISDSNPPFLFERRWIKRLFTLAAPRLQNVWALITPRSHSEDTYILVSFETNHQRVFWLIFTATEHTVLLHLPMNGAHRLYTENGTKMELDAVDGQIKPMLQQPKRSLRRSEILS